MEWLGALVASGRIVDAILVLVAVEAALVALGPRRFGARAPLLAGLTAGAGLMLALRAALAEAAWPWIAAALALALAGHLTEMCLRGREGFRRSATGTAGGGDVAAGALRRREPTVTSREAPALPAPETPLAATDVEPVRAGIPSGRGTTARAPGLAESYRATPLGGRPKRARSTM